MSTPTTEVEQLGELSRSFEARCAFVREGPDEHPGALDSFRDIDTGEWCRPLDGQFRCYMEGRSPWLADAVIYVLFERYMERPSR